MVEGATGALVKKIGCGQKSKISHVLGTNMCDLPYCSIVSSGMVALTDGRKCKRESRIGMETSRPW